MFAFSRLCMNSGTLNHLRSITLTVHQQLSMTQWMDDVLNLLSSSPLEVFQLYSTGAFFESPTTDEFWATLVSHHGRRLIRLSIHRMLISLKAIDNICMKCTALEQLFVVIEPNRLVIWILQRCAFAEAFSIPGEYYVVTVASNTIANTAYQLPARSKF